MFRRTFVLIGRVTRKMNALLSSLWDAVLVGVERCVNFKGYTYTTVLSPTGGEVVITNGKGDVLGVVREGALYQCA